MQLYLPVLGWKDRIGKADYELQGPRTGRREHGQLVSIALVGVSLAAAAAAPVLNQVDAWPVSRVDAPALVAAAARQPRVADAERLLGRARLRQQASKLERRHGERDGGRVGRSGRHRRNAKHARLAAAEHACAVPRALQQQALRVAKVRRELRRVERVDDRRVRRLDAHDAAAERVHTGRVQRGLEQASRQQQVVRAAMETQIRVHVARPQIWATHTNSWDSEVWLSLRPSARSRAKPTVEHAEEGYPYDEPY
eukprot:6204378-Pleurochrysis_carterae.AAC.2